MLGYLQWGALRQPNADRIAMIVGAAPLHTGPFPHIVVDGSAALEEILEKPGNCVDALPRFSFAAP